MKEFLEKKYSKVFFIYILPIFIGLELPIVVNLWKKKGTSFYIWLIIGIIMLLFYAYTSYKYIQTEKNFKDKQLDLERDLGECLKKNEILKKEKESFDKGMRELATLFYDSSNSLNRVANNVLEGETTLDIWSFKKVSTGICSSVYNLLCEICSPCTEFTVNVMLVDPTAKGRKKNITMIAHKGKYEQYPGKFEEKLYFDKYSTFYAVKVCRSTKTDIRILTSKEEINEKFVYIDEEHPEYSQYVGIPIICSGNKIICLLQICSFCDDKIGESKSDILEIVTKYIFPFTHYALLSYKIEKGLINSFSIIENLKKEGEKHEK